MYNGHTESTSTTQSRAWRTALQSQKLAPKLNTEDEADRIRDFITCAELNDEIDVVGEWLESLTPIERDFIGWVVDDNPCTAEEIARDADWLDLKNTTSTL